MKLGLAVFLAFPLLLCASSGRAGVDAEIRGVISDARGGEALARVLVRLENTPYQIVTDAQGRFSLTGMAPGDYDLQVSTVGYQMLRQKISLAAGEVKDFEIVLTQDTGRRTESIQVSSAPFAAAHEDSPSDLTLRGPEAKNLASVLADDPLRAVQGLPGVSSNDDFESRFSLRGAPFHNIGFYLDGVNLHAPFHTVEGQDVSGSLTIINGDTLDMIDLYDVAFPSRFSDATAGALDLVTRDGSREKPSIRISASASNAGFVAEGPLDNARRGDWLISVRKSYLQYLLNRLSVDSALAFGFYDTQEKFSYDLNSRNHISLGIIYGDAGLNRSPAAATLGKNTTTTSDTHYTLLNAAWQWTPGASFLLTNRAAFMREKFNNQNPNNLPLLGGEYGEWVGNSTGAWIESGETEMDFGASLRYIHEDGFTNQYQFNPVAVLRLDASRGHGLRAGTFMEQSWKAAGGRIRVSGGMRWDRHSVDAVDHFSPQVSLALLPLPRTRLTVGWGRYVEYPDLQNFFSRFGLPSLLPERAEHFVGAVEQTLDARTRIRLEFYQRRDFDLLFRPFLEPRLIAGKVFNPPLDPPIRNALQGTARGLEIFLQRRSANRLTGWISYAWGESRMHENEEGIAFPSDEDQRQTANVYLSYRVRPTVNLSVKALYGSGFPIPGFFRVQGGTYFLAASRNQVRQQSYQRTDFRVNKAYVHNQWKMTLYAEAVNLFNRQNTIFESFNGYNSSTGQANLKFLKTFPILPSAGLALEF